MGVSLNGADLHGWPVSRGANLQPQTSETTATPTSQKPTSGFQKLADSIMQQPLAPLNQRDFAAQNTLSKHAISSQAVSGFGSGSVPGLLGFATVSLRG